MSSGLVFAKLSLEVFIIDAVLHDCIEVAPISNVHAKKNLNTTFFIKMSFIALTHRRSLKKSQAKNK
jgi:hypothetical protein